MATARWWGEAEDGAIVEVTVHAGGRGALAERWPAVGLVRHHEPPGAPPVARFALADDGVVVAGHGAVGTGPSAAAWDHLESELALFAAQRLTRLVPVHAAALALRGRVLVVPGPSGAGKSTLAVAAAEQGATVLSDEYALVDPGTGLVTGWTRPVRLRRPDGSVERRDLAVASPPLPVGLVAFVAHDADVAAGWAPLARSEAVVELVAHAICARARPDDTLDAALAVARAAPAVAGVRHGAAAAATELLALLVAGPP